jgi:hypothetical protein
VVWLKGNAIVAAFEIESKTSIYSGLLRMSDLIAMQPNLDIPLYLGAYGVGTTLDLTVNKFVSLQRRTRGDRNDQRGNECRQQTNDLERLARDICFHPVDQTHSAKLARQVALSPGGDDGLVAHQKKHRHDVLAS